MYLSPKLPWPDPAARMQAYHIIKNQLDIEFESKEKGKRRERLRSVIEDIQKKRVEVDELNNKRRKLQFQLIHLQSVKDTIVNLMIPDEPPVASSPLFPVTPPEPFPAPQ